MCECHKIKGLPSSEPKQKRCQQKSTDKEQETQNATLQGSEEGSRSEPVSLGKGERDSTGAMHNESER